MPRNGSLALVLFLWTAYAQAAWECRTVHFRVVSEVGPASAQLAAGHLEELRRRYQDLGFERAGPPQPVVVLLFADKSSLYPFAPQDSRDRETTRGLSLTGEERDWIGVAWNAPGPPEEAFAHEYAHLVRRERDDPLWFREGFAEYIAGLALTDQRPAWTAAALSHAQTLREATWIDWHEFIAAERMSNAFRVPAFYAQAWLAVSWLAAQPGPLSGVRAENLDAILQARGSAWADAQMRGFAARLWKQAPRGVAVRPPRSSLAMSPAPPARETEFWEVPYLKAEWLRELGHWDRARSMLETLELEYPARPEPTESLGFVAIAQHRYPLAERKLRAALLKGSQNPATHHRYSMMLLRPLEAEDSPMPENSHAADRMGRAVWHARQAREADPGQPRYLLGEAQALMVAGQWDAASRLLADLSAVSGWKGRAEVEFGELRRRRQQALLAVALPSLPAVPIPQVAEWLHPVVSSVPEPPAPTEPKLVWPPPGTVLVYGHIREVECRSGGKLVTVKTPRYTIELYEKSGNRAKLYNSPKKWKELPCGLTGHEVNVAYRPLPAGSEARGELVAVVF